MIGDRLGAVESARAQVKYGLNPEPPIPDREYKFNDVSGPAIKEERDIARLIGRVNGILDMAFAIQDSIASVELRLMGPRTVGSANGAIDPAEVPEPCCEIDLLDASISGLERKLREIGASVTRLGGL